VGEMACTCKLFSSQGFRLEVLEVQNVEKGSVESTHKVDKRSAQEQRSAQELTIVLYTMVCGV
jgi:hypothetical protein